MTNRITKAVKQLHLKDFLAPFVYLLLLIPSLIFRIINKLRKRQLWLIAEDGEARDNGYHFYKFVRKNHPNDFCFYAIKKNSVDYDKVARLGNAIKWGSLKHWIYYMSASLNISSQKSGNPCPIFWYVMHVTFGLYKNRVFLQHGITHNDSKWIYYEKTKFKYFVCGAKKEYDHIMSDFGYKEDNLLLAGFSRWDNLRDKSKGKKAILIMPTWRNWLSDGSRFVESDFYKYWAKFLSDKKFNEYIEKEGITVYFYPHINIVKYLHFFKGMSKNIKCVDNSDDIQKYFNECRLLITDYSSVVFDFAYLNKPVIYFQFDEKRYRKEQLQEGYFSYRNDGFGPVVTSCEDVVTQTKKIMQEDGLKGAYLDNKNAFFSEAHGGNSERIYEHLKNGGLV